MLTFKGYQSELVGLKVAQRLRLCSCGGPEFCAQLLSRLPPLLRGVWCPLLTSEAACTMWVLGLSMLSVLICGQDERLGYTEA